MAFTTKGPASRIARELPAIYFSEVSETFSDAVAKSGGEKQFFFEIAGLRVRLRFAGHKLSALTTRTLAHLQMAPTNDFDFTICCWDNKAAGTMLPQVPDYLEGFDARHCLRALSNERFHAFYVEPVRIFSCLDMGTATGYACYLDASHLSMYEVSGPLRAILNAVLNRRGMQIVHASAVGTPEGSVIFAGPPFSGKSTLAIRALMDGMSYQSDDLCVINAEDRPRSFSLYNIAKLREDCVSRFFALTPILSSFTEDFEKKSYFYVHEQFPERILKEAPIRALILTHVVDEPESRLQPATRQAAIVGLMNCTGREIPMTGIVGEKIMFKAINRLPTWHLLIGRDEDGSLELVRKLLGEEMQPS